MYNHSYCGITMYMYVYRWEFYVVTILQKFTVGLHLQTECIIMDSVVSGQVFIHSVDLAESCLSLPSRLSVAHIHVYT